MTNRINTLFTIDDSKYIQECVIEYYEKFYKEKLKENSIKKEFTQYKLNMPIILNYTKNSKLDSEEFYRRFFFRTLELLENEGYCIHDYSIRSKKSLTAFTNIINVYYLAKTYTIAGDTLYMNIQQIQAIARNAYDNNIKSQILKYRKKSIYFQSKKYSRNYKPCELNIPNEINVLINSLKNCLNFKIDLFRRIIYRIYNMIEDDGTFVDNYYSMHDEASTSVIEKITVCKEYSNDTIKRINFLKLLQMNTILRVLSDDYNFEKDPVNFQTSAIILPNYEKRKEEEKRKQKASHRN